MKAARINEYGDATKVVVTDTEKPMPKADQVLVEVHASSLNPFDSAVRSGYMKDSIPLELPVTLGGDIAGVISEIGEDVSGFTVGDMVYGQANAVAGNSGAFAEFAATSANQVAAMPGNLDFVQAAALPLVGVSAVQGLLEHINLQAGQKIFIHGGGGGIGSVAIQIAKYVGAYIATTATGDDTEFVRSLGADEIIDYKQEDFSEKLTDFDAVFDTVGGEDFVKSYRIVKRGGVAVSMIAQPDEAKANELGVTALAQSTIVTTGRLDTLSKLVENGALKPQVTKTFPLDNIVEAFRAREAGKYNGKITLTIA